MLKEVKDFIEEYLKRVGIPEENIIRTKADEEAMQTSVSGFYAVISSEPGRFSDPSGMESFIKTDAGKVMLKACARRNLPVSVKIVGPTEESVDTVFSSFIGNLPSSFTIGLRLCSVGLDTEEHSDKEAAITSRYESTITIIFSIDIGPEPINSRKLIIRNVEIGGIANGSSE